MANIPAATASTADGVNITTPATASALSMTMGNDGLTLLHVKTGATTATLTFVPQRKMSDGSTAGMSGTSLAKSLLANQNYVFGPFSPSVHNDANGELNMTFSAITNIVVQAQRVVPVV